MILLLINPCWLVPVTYLFFMWLEWPGLEFSRDWSLANHSVVSLLILLALFWRQVQDFLCSVIGDLSWFPQPLKGDKKQCHNDIICLSALWYPSYLVPQAYIGREYNSYWKKCKLDFLVQIYTYEGIQHSSIISIQSIMSSFVTEFHWGPQSNRSS